jgi:hypothetical protein
MNRYGPQDDLILARQCDQETLLCLSTDELYTLYLQRAISIREADVSELNLNLEAFVEMKSIVRLTVRYKQ